MAKCLVQANGQVSEAPDRSVVHTLVNLVQGRMLEYLSDRICRDYGIDDEHSRFQVMTALLSAFSDEFFALFRSKIDFSPTLALSIARRIIRKEIEHAPTPPAATSKDDSDRLYPAIFRKYFEYRNLAELQRMVESDAEIEKIILLARLRREVQDSQRYQRLVQILEQDREGFCTSFFMDCLRHNRLQKLIALVESGAWESEVNAVREHMAHLRGE
jgi:hypothetical protein